MSASGVRGVVSAGKIEVKTGIATKRSPMNTLSLRRAKSRRVACSRRAVVALLAIAVTVAPTFFRTAKAAAKPQASTLEALAKMREAWVQDLRTKQLEPILKFYAPDAAFLQPDGERGVRGIKLQNWLELFRAQVLNPSL